MAKEIADLKVAIGGVVREVSASNARVDGLEKRIDGVDREIGRLKFAFCDTDRLPHDECVLKDAVR